MYSPLSARGNNNILWGLTNRWIESQQDSFERLEREQFTKDYLKIGRRITGRLYAAFRSKDFTKPPTYDFTMICSDSSTGTSSGGVWIGGI